MGLHQATHPSGQPWVALEDSCVGHVVLVGPVSAWHPRPATGEDGRRAPCPRRAHGRPRSALTARTPRPPPKRASPCGSCIPTAGPRTSAKSRVPTCRRVRRIPERGAHPPSTRGGPWAATSATGRSPDPPRDAWLLRPKDSHTCESRPVRTAVSPSIAPFSTGGSARGKRASASAPVDRRPASSTGGRRLRRQVRDRPRRTRSRPVECRT